MFLAATSLLQPWTSRVIVVSSLYCRYKANIDGITDDGMVAISFEEYGTNDVTQLTLIKTVSEAADLLLASQPKGPRWAHYKILKCIHGHILLLLQRNITYDNF